MLSSSQLYYIKKAKHRKAFRMAAVIRRICGNNMIHVRMIKYQMNGYLHERFQICRMQELDTMQYESYLQAIEEYQFFYMGHTFQ